MTAPPPDIAPGEYLDVTLSWENASRAQRASVLAAVGVAMSLIAIRAMTSALAAQEWLLGWFFWSATIYIVLAGVWLGEPKARWVRTYAASGRLDIVSAGGKIQSFPRDKWVLILPTSARRTGVTLVPRRGPDGHQDEKLNLDITPRLHRAVESLWNRDDIAPPFGGNAKERPTDHNATSEPRRTGNP